MRCLIVDDEEMATKVIEKSLILRERVEACEKEVIAEALSRSNGNQSEAARLLGISRPTLAQRIQEYGLVPKLRRRSYIAVRSPEYGSAH